ncbi:MAG: ATP-binding protein, partial [Candidatus Eisenbacteria bacterium]|nr:ATP-binding protein [Candidatus Eisenbacteria bacterium]
VGSEMCIRDSQAARRKIARTTLLVSGSLGLTILGSLALLLAFVRGVLNPVRRLAREAREARGEEAPSRLAGPEDELREVGRYLRDLVSDVEESREQIERSRVHLESAEKLASVGKLAASVAHEIRNPLTSIRMRLYTLRHQIGSGGSGGGGGSAGGSGGRGGGGGIDGAGGVDLADQAEDFEVIDSELRRLESIVHNFLEFSRPPQLSPRVEPIPPLIEQTLELMEPWLESRRVRVHCDLETDLPRVFADAAQIRQVFVNLIRNAVEAMPEGGELTVTGCAARNPSGSDGVALRFEDTGPGIADEARERIFDPFFTTKAEGTGLGLTIAAWIVARHEGRLDLEGTGPRGSRFSLWLPSAAAHREG